MKTTAQQKNYKSVTNSVQSITSIHNEGDSSFDLESFSKKAKNKSTNELEILLFTRHLSIMLKAGIPIIEALETLFKQTKSSNFKNILASTILNIRNGQTLSGSFKKYPKVFSNFYTSLIEVSEESGTLDDNLHFISLELTKNYNFKRKVKTASLYPLLILIATVIMGSFISFFILPQLIIFFEAFEIALPLSTRILLSIAYAFRDFGLFISIGFLLLLLILKILLSSKIVLPYWHAFLLKLPIFGSFILSSQLSQFSRNFGVLIKSGVPISRSFEIANNTLTNMKIKNSLSYVQNKLNMGIGISESIDQKKISVFPPLFSKMIGVGEKTGNLDESLLYLSNFYEEEIDNFSKNLTTILEPALLLTIGLIVGFVALSIITPIYELSGSIRR